MPPEAVPHALSCPEPATLVAYDVGELPAAELESIARHLERCAACLQALQSLSSDADPLVASLRRCSSATPLPEDEARAVALVAALADPYATTAPPARPTNPCVPDGPSERIGPYELLSPLGAGGMGSVYKARHVHLGKIVALKLLPPERVASPAVRTRFRQEMQAVGRLAHPHIVQAFDAEVDDVPYLAMEYVEGIDLAKLLHQHGRLPVADACELVRQVALGLQHAHEHGLVHRDVKPSNLILTNTGVVKVLDLGLARLHAEEPTDASLTAAGAIMGTPDYMAPEQLLDSHAVDIRADLYSLGCTLYHLLAGQPPFGDADHATFGRKRKAHLSEPIPPIRQRRPDVPVALAALLDRLAAKEPADRFATPNEVVAALQPLTSGCRLEVLLGAAPATVASAVETERPESQPTVPIPRARVPRRRWPWIAATLGGVGLLLAAWALFKPAPPAPLRVVRFEVRHSRKEPDRVRSLPPIGGAGFAGVRFDDWVRVALELSEPAYCYLIAFNPDGRDQLCFPADVQAEPAPRQELLYPEGTAFFRLNDGVGLQAFVLLASRRPLPSYAAWKARVGPLPWSKAVGAGVWRYDGRTFHPLDSGPRGQEDQAPVPAAFAELCKHLRERGEGVTLEAIVFPVRAKEAQRP